MKIKSFFVGFMLLTSLLGCKRDESGLLLPPEQDFKPTGNNLVIGENLIGTAKRFSTFEKMVDDGMGTFYFAGKIDGQEVIGRMSKSGSLIWQRNVNFQVNQIRWFGGVSTLENAILVVGQENNKAVICLYDINGTLRSSIGFTEYPICIFNDVKLNYFHNNLYICSAIGGAGNTYNSINPYWVYFTVDSNGMISKSIPNNSFSQTQKIFSQYNQMYFTQFSDGYDWSGIGQGIYSNNSTLGISSSLNSENKQISLVHIKEKIGVNSTNISLDIEWAKTISLGDFYGKLKHLLTINNKIYAVGWRETTNGKNRKTTNGGYWTAGLIIVLNLENGNIVSERELSVSQNDDIIDFIAEYDNNIYVCGTSSNFTKLEKTRNVEYKYGYAWIARISETGVLQNSKTFGESTGRHYFHRAIPFENKIYAIGFKNYLNDEEGHKAWFAELNRSGL